MQKLVSPRVYIIAIVLIVVCTGMALVIRSCSGSRDIQASITPLNAEQGVPVFFADSTKGAHQWLWEFGNNDVSAGQRGSYTFPGTGRYQVRLTVNGNAQKKFVVQVRPQQKTETEEQLVRVIAPYVALQGEYVTFRGEGSSAEWRWEFGETGRVDAYEKTAIYRYETAGLHTVSLRTEETKYPVLHTIEIIPQYMNNDTTDVVSVIANDIREKLQAIVDQKPFNKNYNYILDTYLCNNPRTPVIVNNNKKNDFYSYCQGLLIIGRKRTRIEQVVIDMDEASGCVKKLIVIQTDLDGTI